MSAVYDAVIVGGGPAGGAAAGVLAKAGCRVLLAEKSDPLVFKVGESLVPAARTILEELGGLDPFLSGPHRPCYGNQSAWGSEELFDRDFIRSPYGHGWHLDRGRFDESLRQHAAQRGAVVKYGTKLRAFERRRDSWHVEFESNAGVSSASCRWLADGRGRSRRIVRDLQVPREHLDRQVAYYVRCQSRRSADDDHALSLVESVREGWWYTARLPQDGRIVILFTDSRVPWSEAMRTQRGFCELLAQAVHVSSRLAECEWQVPEPPRPVDARTTRLERFSGTGWIAVGDAAMSLDPLSSQGILTALYGGLKAARLLLNQPDALTQDNPDYHEALSSVFDRFRQHQRDIYLQEQRWPESPYWQRRHRLQTAPATRPSTAGVGP